MGAQGTASLDFGAFPGSSITQVDVTSAGIISTSALEAWIRPVSTADHTDMDHIAAPIRVTAMFLSNDNMRVFGINDNQIVPPLESQPIAGIGDQPSGLRGQNFVARQNAPMLVGIYSVWWVWN